MQKLSFFLLFLLVAVLSKACMFLFIYSVITVNEINLIAKNSTMLDRKCQFGDSLFAHQSGPHA